MSTLASMINLGYSDRLVFAVPVPEWSTQHELVINSANSWIKYPSPKGWEWLKLPLNENYTVVGLSTPKGLAYPDNTMRNGHEILGTIIRSHIITNAERFGIVYKETGVYLVLEMHIGF